MSAKKRSKPSEEMGILRILAYSMGQALGDELRNDCGYEGRFAYEDTSRALGYYPQGEGLCDYYHSCPLYKRGECPLVGREE